MKELNYRCPNCGKRNAREVRMEKQIWLVCLCGRTSRPANTVALAVLRWFDKQETDVDRKRNNGGSNDSRGSTNR